jgi:GTPase SAR1 family protein
MVKITKITLIGDGGVGKTALRERFMGQGFAAEYLMTIGADFGVKNLSIGAECGARSVLPGRRGSPVGL